MSGRRAGQGRGTGVAMANRPWHRGEQQSWRGCVATPCNVRKMVSRRKPGAQGGMAGGAAKWPGQVAAPAYGTGVGTVQGSRGHYVRNTDL